MEKQLHKYEIRWVKAWLLTTIMVFAMNVAHSQVITNYQFSTDATSSFTTDLNSNVIDMSTGTTTLIGSGVVNGSGSGLISFPSGFTFTVMGVINTQFSVSSHGWLGIGVGLTNGNGWLGGGTAGNPRVAPLLVTTTAGGFVQAMGTSPSGRVHYKLVGTAPNRTLVIEYLNMTINANTSASTTVDGTFQARLYERTGVLEFIYGSINVSGSASIFANIGFSNTTTVYQSVATTTHTSSNTVSTTPNYAPGPVSDLNGGGTPTTRRAYRYTPVIPLAPGPINFTAVTGASMTLNWADNATNEAGYTISRSTDGGSTFTTIATLGANTTTFVATGLVPNSTYTWRVTAFCSEIPSFQINSVSGSQSTIAGSTVLSLTSGGWKSPSTWVGGIIPTASDSVVIMDGHIVTIDTSAATCYSLNVGTGASGELVYANTPAATLTVGSSVYVNGGAIFSAGAGTLTTHNLRIGGPNATSASEGSLIVNGTFDMQTTAGVTVTFFGNANSRIDGTPALLDFRSITVNKGATSTNYPVLEILTPFTVQGATTVGLIGTHTAGLVRIGGTYSLSNPIYTTAAYTIPLNGGLHLNNPNFIVTSTNGSPTCNGLLRVTQGTYNVMQTNAQVLGFGAGATFTVDGGIVNAAARINSANTMTFNFSSGAINVATVGNNTSASPSFGITAAASVINWTGGTLTLVQRSTGATQQDYNVVPVSNFAGGTLQIGNASTITNFNFNIRGNAPNVIIDNTSTPKIAQLGAQLNVWQNITVQTGTTLNLNGFALLQAGTALLNDGFVDGRTANSAWVFFPSVAGHTYSGLGLDTLATVTVQDTNSIVLNKSIVAYRVNFLSRSSITNSNNITLGNGLAQAVTVQIGVANYTAGAVGTFDVAPNFNFGSGTYSLIYQQEGTMRATGNEIPLSRSISNLTIADTNNVTVSGGHIDITGTLTMTAGRLITSDTGMVRINNTVAGAVTGGSASAYVNGPLQRRLPANLITTSTYAFPVGKSTAYAPVDLLNPGTNSGGTVDIIVERFNTAATGTVDGTLDSLVSNYHWKISIPSGVSNLDSAARIRFGIPPGLNGFNRIAYATSLSGTFGAVSSAPEPNTFTTNKLTGGGSVEGIYTIGIKTASISGTFLVGATRTSPDYKDLSEAFRDITSKRIEGDINLIIMNDYTSATETFPIVITDPIKSNPSWKINVYPNAGSTAVVTGSVNGPLFNLNGIKNLTIDGRDGGNNNPLSLTIVNENTGTSASTIQFINDASNNTIQYVTLRGASTSASSGVVVFGTGVITGNDSNTIDACDIGDAAATPANLIHSLGSTDSVSRYNHANRITNCNLYNFFNSTAEANAISMRNGNNSWTVTGNSVYQTVSRNTTALHYYFNFQNSGNLQALNNMVISGNYIGGSAPRCGGTPWTMSSAAGRLCSFFNVGDVTKSVISHNTFNNFNVITTSTATTAPGAWNAIQYVGGRMDIDSNTIGTMTGVDSIRVTCGSLGLVMPIAVTMSNVPVGTFSISGNKIGGITADGGGTVSNAIQLLTITSAPSGVTYNIRNNELGNTIPNNIRAAASSSASAQSIRGINNSSAAVLNINNNFIRNFTNLVSGTSASSVVIGILTSAGKGVISDNLIDSLSSSSPSTGVTTLAAVSGIVVSASDTFQILRNTILALRSNAASAATQVNGIVHTGASNRSIIARNLVHSFTSTSTSATAQHNGIISTAGANLIANNMIRLGIDETGTSVGTNTAITGINKTGGNTHIYYNSVYIGGIATATGAANTFAFSKTGTNNDTIANNIFVNERSNSTTGGKHYAIQLLNNTNSVCDYNILFVTGTGTFTGLFNGVDHAGIGTWRIATGGDGNSLSNAPGFISASAGIPNLRISGTTVIEGVGSTSLSLLLPTISEDFEGDLRASNTPVDLGADAGLFTPSDLSPPVLLFSTLPNDTVNTSRVFTNYVQISDPSGIASGLNSPRLYYKRKIDANAFVGNTQADNGWKYVPLTGSSPFSFTIDYSLLFGGVIAVGDTIEYFIVGQDASSNNNVGAVPSVGFTAVDVTNITTAPTTPLFFRIVGLPLSGNYNVGTSGLSDYPTITSAVQSLNDRGVAGPVTFTLIDATYTTPAETFPITISGGYTGNSQANPVIFKPVGVTSISASSTTSIFRFDNAANVTIDGSLNVNGTSRDLTITNTNTSANTAVVWIGSRGTGQGSSRIAVKNCRIANGSSGAINFGVYVGGSTIGATGADNDFITIENDTIYNTVLGISVRGGAAVSTGGNDSLILKNNAIVISATVGSVHGIQVTNTIGSLIEGNVVDVQTTALGAPVGISLELGVTNSTVAMNKVLRSFTSATGGYAGRGLTVATGSITSNITLVNNFITGVNGSNWNTFGNSSSIGIGIGILGNTSTLNTVTGDVKLYHNTVNLFGSMGTGSTTAVTASLWVGAGASSIDVRNNIFVNTQSATSATQFNYVVYSDAPNSAFTHLNYNNYYAFNSFNAPSARIGFIGTGAQNTLSDWANATGKDGNSINDSTNFISNSDLHITGSTLGNVIYSGTPVVGVLTDIDNEVRVAGFPYMGADESTSTPLPVTLTSFTAEVIKSNVELKWNTATEVNNNGFDVERSVDGRNFKQVRFIQGAGNSNREVAYQYTDVDAFAKTVANVLYYRLKQTDFNGAYTYSQVIRVAQKAQRINAVSVYPNPFSNELNINFTSDQIGTAVIELTDLHGKQIGSYSYTVSEGLNTLPISEVSNLNIGVYFAKVIVNNESVTIKLVKN